MIFMKYGGIDKGSSSTEGHKGSEGWMELSGLQWGVGRNIANASQGLDREPDTASVSEVVVSKKLDLASYRLFEESTHGTGQDVTIHITKTDKQQQVTYMEYVLSNVLISGFSTSCGGERPEETIALNFTKIEFNYTEQDPKNQSGDTPKTSWDLAASKKS